MGATVCLVPAMTVYFAYGANLDRAGMVRRCPRSHPIGPARLEDHRFFVTADGYASIRAERGAIVHGHLWRLAEADIADLDSYEEVDAGLYRRATLQVFGTDGPQAAMVYLGASTTAGAAVPGYMEAVVAAAEALALPGTYVGELRGWLPRS